MIKEIKKGDRFVCVAHHVNNDGSQEIGNIYIADKDGNLPVEHHISWVPKSDDGFVEFSKCFIPHTYKSVEKYYRTLSRKSTEDIEIVKIFDVILRQLFEESITDDFEDNNLAWAMGGLQASCDAQKPNRLPDDIVKGWEEAWMKDAQVNFQRNSSPQPSPEPLHPKYYDFTINGTKCNMFDIARALGLSLELFSALKYFRVKGGVDKKINDLEKAKTCIDLEIGKLRDL